MNWNDWEMIWRRQEPPVGASADLTKLKESFEPKRRKLARALLVRNSIEGVGGALLALMIASVTWRTGQAGWPILIGAALILGVSVVFIRDLLRLRRNRLGPEAPLLAKVEAEIAELRHQRRLIDYLGTWYFLPYVAAIVIIGSTLARTSARRAPPGLLTAILTTPATLAWVLILVGTTAVAIFWAWRANRNSLHQRLDPRLEELEKLRRDLLAPQ